MTAIITVLIFALIVETMVVMLLRNECKYQKQQADFYSRLLDDERKKRLEMLTRYTGVCYRGSRQLQHARKKIASLTIENNEYDETVINLLKDLNNVRRYNELLVMGHDPQCNARDGFPCDCGVTGETTSDKNTQNLTALNG